MICLCLMQEKIFRASCKKFFVCLMQEFFLCASCKKIFCVPHARNFFFCVIFLGFVVSFAFCSCVLQFIYNRDVDSCLDIICLLCLEYAFLHRFITLNTNNAATFTVTIISSVCTLFIISLYSCGLLCVTVCSVVTSFI